MVKNSRKCCGPYLYARTRNWNFAMLSYYQSSITSPFEISYELAICLHFQQQKNMSCPLTGYTVTCAYVATLAMRNSESAMPITYRGIKLPLFFEACPSYSHSAWERCGHGCHQPDSNHSSLDHEHAPGLLRHGIFIIFFSGLTRAAAKVAKKGYVFALLC